MCRLAAKEGAARRFLFKNPKHVKIHVPPGGYEHPTRQFLKIFQNCKNAQTIEVQGYNYIHFAYQS